MGVARVLLVCAYVRGRAQACASAVEGGGMVRGG